MFASDKNPGTINSFLKQYSAMDTDSDCFIWPPTAEYL